MVTRSTPHAIGHDKGVSPFRKLSVSLVVPVPALPAIGLTATRYFQLFLHRVTDLQPNGKTPESPPVPKSPV